MMLLAWAVLVTVAVAVVGGTIVLNVVYGWLPTPTAGNGLKEWTDVVDAVWVVAAAVGLIAAVCWAVVTVANRG